MPGVAFEIMAHPDQQIRHPMSNSTLSYALVGCGMIGGAHLRGLQRLREAGINHFVLQAVCDTKKERAEIFAARAGQFQSPKPRVYTNYCEMLEREPLDAVDLCTVHDSHHVIGMDVLRSGKHLLVEKPLALTIKSGRALIKTAEESGKILATAENYRRQPYFRMIQWALASGILGRVNTLILLDSSFGNFIIEDTDWRHLRKHCGAGMVTDRGIHHADLFEYFLGPIEEAYGVVAVLSPERYTFDPEGKLLRSLQCDAEDTCSGLMKFRSGAAGLWHITAAGHGELLDEMDLCLLGGKGSIRGGRVILDDGRQIFKEQMIQNFMQALDADQKEQWFPKGITDAFAIEQYDFSRSILSGTPPEIDGRRGLRAMAVCYAFCESSLTGKPVRVDDVENGTYGEFQRELDAWLEI